MKNSLESLVRGIVRDELNSLLPRPSGGAPLTPGQKAAATRRAAEAVMTPGQKAALTRKRRAAGRKAATARAANAGLASPPATARKSAGASRT